MMIKTTVVLLPFVFLVLFITGCATAHLTHGGKTVRVVNVSPTGCKYLGQIAGHQRGSIDSGIVHDADVEEFRIIDLKNKAAEIGADTVQVIGSRYKEAVGEAYFCSDSTRVRVSK